ncbi:MAG: CDP-alcohol phosphatidyltransferase family protein [Clostridia bacterium]|nr:CDP-alcohol phosphatidyltransferase family protein [Clostridia bacterium]
MRPEKRKEIYSIPNLLCYVRILLLPIFAVLFCLKMDTAAAIVVLLSAATDVADGIIARKFHMETELGKILDPLADKLSQAVISGCLLFRYPIMWLLFSVIIIKESFQGIGGLLLYRKVKSMRSSEWFGKLSTAFFYTVVAYLVLFTPKVANAWYVVVPVLVSTGLMVFALIRYAIRFIQVITALKTENETVTVE